MIRAALLLLVGCSCSSSGNKTTPKTAHEDARAGSAQPVDAAIKIDPSAKADVQVRVEWKDVPADARAAPGRTACGAARPAAVAPTTTWGVPDVLVAIEATASSNPSPTRIALADCVLTPRIAVAHGSLSIASAAQTPAKLAIQRAGQLPLGGAIKQDKAREIYLPVAGHQVDVALDAGAIYRIAAGDELAWVVAAESPFVAVTEASGAVLFRDVPAGIHAVTAWLPARSGQAARIAKGSVTVATNGYIELTLDITKQ